MKRIFYPMMIALCGIALPASSQIWVWGPLITSSVFTFETADSLHKAQGTLDTANSGIWKIGSTVKPFFASPDTPSRAIMTRLDSAYGVNANTSFILNIANSFMNPVITFKHKFQTTAGKDGGMVEFSANGGAWQNVLGDCHTIASFGVNTDSFYTAQDTLASGDAAFSGTSNGWVTSTMQFLWAVPLRGTSPCMPLNNLRIRFRFLSDSVAENLDGWMIDSIQLKQYEYPGAIDEVIVGKLNVLPNPSHTGLFQFPELPFAANNALSITTVTGQLIQTGAYKRTVDLSMQPAGIYFYQVNNGNNRYRGKIVKSE